MQSRPKLIIHLDINGTIMPADPIKSKHVESMLNIHLSKQAFVKEFDGDYVWWNGSPFHKGDHPPLLPQMRYTCHIRDHYDEDPSEICCHISPGNLPSGPISIQDYRDAVSSGEGCDDFTRADFPGSAYLSELEKLLTSLEWKFAGVDPEGELEKVFTLPGLDGKRMSLFVPSFLSFLAWLHEDSGREYVLIVRTFGADIPRLWPAFLALSKGLHPYLPKPGCVAPPSLFGSLVQTDAVSREYRLDVSGRRAESGEGLEYSILGNLKILDFLEALPNRSILMVNDDYELWRSHGFDPVFGKPVFFDPDRIDRVHHFLFDDNVNLNPRDSIACVWLRSPGSSRFVPQPISSAAGLATVGTILLQANLYNSILNPNAFIDELLRAENRYSTLLARIANSI